jgi:hypothetical protein
MADEKTDVFAFGVVLWELLTQEKPHFGFKSHQVQDFTLSGQRPPIKSLPFGFHTRFIDIICACWHQVRRPIPAAALRLLLPYACCRPTPAACAPAHPNVTLLCRTRRCGRRWRRVGRAGLWRVTE